MLVVSCVRMLWLRGGVSLVMSQQGATLPWCKSLRLLPQETAILLILC